MVLLDVWVGGRLLGWLLGVGAWRGRSVGAEWGLGVWQGRLGGGARWL